MKSLRILIILNIAIFLVSASAGKTVLHKRSASNEYSDENEDQSVGEDEKVQSIEDECEASFIPYIECQHDNVLIVLSHDTNHGKFYVNEHSHDKHCMQKLSKSSHNTSLTIPFGKCGLEKNAEVHMNITVMPDDEILGEDIVTFPVTCEYRPHNSTVSDDLPQKELEYKPQEPANATGPPDPTYNLTITEKKSNDPKDKGVLMAEICISPEVADARAKNCYAFAKNDTTKHYDLTDGNGCPVHSTRFPGWTWDKRANKLTSEFKTFNLVGADITGINCTVVSCHKSDDCGPPCPKADSQRRKCRGH